MRKTNWFERANLWIREVESSMLNFFSLIVPFGASLLPAYMSWYNLGTHMRFSPFFAGVGGVVFELMGLTTLHTLVQFWHHNRKIAPIELDSSATYQAKVAAKRKESELLPIGSAIFAYAFYILLTLALNVALDMQTMTPVEIFTRAIICLLPIPSGLMMTTRTLYTEMLFDKEREKEARKIARQETKVEADSEISRKVSKQQPLYDDWRHVPENHRRMIARMKPKQVESQYHVIDRTARNWVNWAIKEFGNGSNGHSGEN